MEAGYDSNITINPSTNTITATNFAGNASTADSLNNKLTIGTYEYDGSTDVTIPIYDGAYTIA